MQHLSMQEPIHVFCPITRVDAKKRIVEGYCYTQAKVKGDKWNLKRETLERAGAKFMEMPAIRAMHRNDIAAGVGLSLAWDEKGGKISAKIVDDQEWRKVEEGVYRGFSIGGAPIIVRGNDVEEFDWKEISLVDRPADAGALFTVVRAAGTLPSGGYDVLVLEDNERAPVNVPQVLAGLEANAGGGRAWLHHDARELQRRQWQSERDRIEREAETEPNAEKRRRLVSRLMTLEHLLR